LSGKREQLYQEGYRYLRRYGKWMRYQEYRAVGLPLGSGGDGGGVQNGVHPTVEAIGDALEGVRAYALE